MKLPFLEIHWIDSETETGWDTPESIKFPTKNVKSYGFCVKENEEYITLAADIDVAEKHLNRFIHIPKINVKKKRKVKL